MLMNWHLYSTVPEYECDHVFTFLGGWRCVECGELFNPTITIIPIRDVLRAMAKITSSGDGQALREREEGSEAMKMPLCKCGRVRQFYNEYAGFSVRCRRCNNIANAKSRARRAKRKS